MHFVKTEATVTFIIYLQKSKQTPSSPLNMHSDPILYSVDGETRVLRLSIFNDDQWNCWLKQFSRMSQTGWNVRQTFPHCV